MEIFPYKNPGNKYGSIDRVWVEVCTYNRKVQIYFWLTGNYSQGKFKCTPYGMRWQQKMGLPTKIRLSRSSWWDNMTNTMPIAWWVQVLHVALMLNKCSMICFSDDTHTVTQQCAYCVCPNYNFLANLRFAAIFINSGFLMLLLSSSQHYMISMMKLPRHHLPYKVSLPRIFPILPPVTGEFWPPLSQPFSQPLTTVKPSHSSQYYL